MPKRGRSFASYSSGSRAKSRRISHVPYSATIRRRTTQGSSRITNAGLYGSKVPGSARHVMASRSGKTLPLYVVPTMTSDEMHYHRTNLDDGDVNGQTWHRIAINTGIDLGSALTDRAGREISMKRVLLKLDYGAQATWALSEGTCRFALVYQKQTFGLIPPLGDVFASAIASKPWTDFPQSVGRDKYSILYDQTFTLNKPGTGNGYSTRFFDLDINLGNRRVRYDSTGSGEVANINLGVLYLYYCMEGPATSGQNPFHTFHTELQYSP